MVYFLKLFVMVMYDEFISMFVVVGFFIFGLNVLWSYWVFIKVMIFIIIMWVVYWVYCGIVNGWMNIMLVCSICFIQNVQYMFSIVNFVQSCMVVCFYFMYFIRMQMQGDISIIMSNDLNVSISGMCQLIVFIWFYFYVMNSRINWDVVHWQGVIWFDCSINVRLNLVVSFQVFRGQDVMVFIVFVQNQCDVCGMVWIVFKMFNNCWDIVFVVFEVNNTVSLFVVIIDMMSGDMVIVVMIIGFVVFFQ